MKKTILCLYVAVSIIFISCTAAADTVTTYRIDKIDIKIAQEISALDNEVIGFIKTGNIKGLSEIAAAALRNEDINGFISNINSLNLDPEDLNFTGFDRYYSRVAGTGNVAFSVTTEGSAPFYAALSPGGHDTVLSLISTGSGISDKLLTLVYINEDGAWKLNNIDLTTYRLHGMNAMDMYEKAKKLDENGHILPACLYTAMAKDYLRPAPFLQYTGENDFNKYYDDIIGRFINEYSFPFMLENTAGTQLYGFRLQYTLQGLYPVIRYTTGLERSDTSSIENEARDIHKEVTRLFSGMEEEFDYFIYEAYFEPPVDSEKMYYCYRTLIEP